MIDNSFQLFTPLILCRLMFYFMFCFLHLNKKLYMLFIKATKYSKRFGFNKEIKLDRHLTRTITPSMNLRKRRFPFRRPIHPFGSLVKPSMFLLLSLLLEMTSVIPLTLLIFFLNILMREVTKNVSRVALLAGC